MTPFMQTACAAGVCVRLPGAQARHATSPSPFASRALCPFASRALCPFASRALCPFASRAPCPFASRTWC